MQHQKPPMIHQYQMQQVEEKNLQQTSHEEFNYCRYGFSLPVANLQPIKETLGWSRQSPPPLQSVSLMITTTHKTENLSKKFKCNECKNQNPPPIWRQVTQWKTCEEILQTWGKKSSKSYGVVVFSRTSYVAHLVAPTIPPAKNKIDVYVTRKKLFQLFASNDGPATFEREMDGPRLWIKSF